MGKISGSCKRTILRALALAALPLLATSCQLEPTPENLKPIIRKVDGLRPASLEFWETRTIHGWKARDYGSNVAALLAPLDMNITVVENGDTVRVRLQGQPGKSYGFGSAVPISRDGYFLTAAHCVGEKGSTIRLLVKTVSPSVSVAVARVVWTTDETKPGEPDLAILHAPLKPQIPVNLVPWDRIKPGQPILTSGYGSLKKSSAGGRLLSISDPKTSPSGVPSRELTHTAPFTPGDSGGPMLSEDGGLLGINSQLVLTTSGWLPFGLGPLSYDHGVCFIPSAEWLETIIKRDRHQRHQRRNRR